MEGYGDKENRQIFSFPLRIFPGFPVLQIRLWLFHGNFVLGGKINYLEVLEKDTLNQSAFEERKEHKCIYSSFHHHGPPAFL